MPAQLGSPNSDKKCINHIIYDIIWRMQEPGSFGMVLAPHFFSFIVQTPHFALF